MASFYVWSILIILYQAVVCVVFTWLTVECKLAPQPDDAHELTLIKMLYLFEPETCDRHYYYNYSIPIDRRVTVAQILWMGANPVAASFRSKMKLWLSLHLTWLGLALLNVSLGRRPCGFYAILLPLTVTGIAIMVVDLVHAVMFLIDATHTRSESQIWAYIGNVQVVKTYASLPPRVIDKEDDTSWVSLLFAYTSLRGVVQWIINFWIIQDNYFDGLQYYREIGVLQANKRRKLTAEQSFNVL